jgi:tripartite ATP-independent transporter DctM subunit
MNLEPGELTLAVAILFVALLAVGLPVAFVAGGTAVLLTLAMFGPDMFGLLVLRTWDLMVSYAFVAAPMFVLMAVLLERAGVADDLYRAILLWMGRVPGGLAVATVLACMIIASMVGIIGAAIVMMGIVALPQMLRRGYDQHLATGTVCAAGCLGILIPPSILFIVYSMVAGAPVADLFAGAVGPGLLLGLGYIAYIVILCALRPAKGPPLPREALASLREKLAALRSLLLPAALVVAVLGSIFAGVATPTEAAGIGAIGAAIAAALRGRLSLKMLDEAARQTVVVAAMIMWILFGAGAMTTIYTFGGGQRYMEELIGGLDLSPLALLVALMVLLFLLGTLLDWLPILMLVGPVMLPLVSAAGIDLVLFGVLFAVNMQISFLTPPFGPALYYLKSVAPPGITMRDVNRSIWPFIAVQVTVLALCVAFPDIVLWLPRVLRP